jgi:hypothetical protein
MASIEKFMHFECYIFENLGSLHDDLLPRSFLMTAHVKKLDFNF